MKRSNTVGVLSHHFLTDYKQKVAYHEAGHATAIHFNSQKNLPPVFFQIILKDVGEQAVNTSVAGGSGRHESVARVKGGRLIESLPLAFDQTLSTGNEKRVFWFTDDYRLAFEADIVNLLVGPLAEAKFCAQMDDEPFKRQLLTVQALKNYGGEADLAVIDDYLKSYSANQLEQNENLNWLFNQAYNFVNDNTHWKAISKLAQYILTSNNNKISCNEVAAVLDS